MAKAHAGAAQGTADPGKKQMDVSVACEIPCNIPFAAQILCKGSPSHVSFEAKQQATATGCDSGS